MKWPPSTNMKDRGASSPPLEFEGPSTSTWRGVSDGEPALFAFIERYYNPTRLRSDNRYKTPNETEAASRNRALAA